MVRKDMDNTVTNTIKHQITLMGIINATQDSFSGDGIYSSHQSSMKNSALSKNTAHILQKRLDLWLSCGLSVVDIGGQSTRPGAQKIDETLEMSRVIPIIRWISHHYDTITISVDTFIPQIAYEALICGASIVNDVSGDASTTQAMARMITAFDDAKKTTTQLVITDNTVDQAVDQASYPAHEHNVSEKQPALSHSNRISHTPRATMAHHTGEDFQHHQRRRLTYLANSALREGVKPSQLVLDPGIGFGKTVEQNFECLSIQPITGVAENVLIGASNKSFLQHATNTTVSQRLPANLAIAALLMQQNFQGYLRVHDVPSHHHFLTTLDRAHAYAQQPID